MISTLLLKHWRYVAGAALLAALLGGLVYVRHTGYVAGAAAVRAQWVADTQARDKATAEAIAASRQKEQDALAHNEVIEREYMEKVATATADRDSVYRLLQQARNQVRASAGREATSATIAATAGEAQIAERVDRAVAGVVAESRLNADQLDALIAVVKPQM